MPINVNFYVSMTGVDAGPCTSPLAPGRTIGYVAALAMQNTTPGLATVNIGPGTWDESVNINGDPPSYPNARSGPFPPWVGLLFQGDGNTTVWGPDAGCDAQCGALIANGGANVGIRNLALRTYHKACQSALYAQLGGHIHVFDNVLAMEMRAAFAHAEDVGSYVQFWNDVSILGGVTMGSFGNAATGGMIKINGGTVTLNGPPSATMTDGLFNASGAHILIGPGASFAGSINGRAIVLSGNAVLDCGGFTRAPWTPGCQSVEGLGNVAKSVTSGAQCL